MLSSDSGVWHSIPVCRLIAHLKVRIPVTVEEMFTYARELDTTITAFRGGSSLLDVKSAELTSRGLDDSGFVGGGVVAIFPYKLVHRILCDSK